MSYRLTADVLVVLHLAYILFVVIGGLFALRWRWIALIHLPAAAWGILIEIMGWICPLTPWEVKLRIAAGEVGYDGSFIEHYLIPVIYPTGVDARTAAQLRYDRPLHQCSRLRHHRQSLDYEIVALTTHSHPARPVIRSSGYGRD